MSIKKKFFNSISFENKTPYKYDLSQTQIANNSADENNLNNNSSSSNNNKSNKKISSNLKSNQDYITVKYNALINSDIVLRNFNLNIKGSSYPALLFYIDGMVDSTEINTNVLKPLMMKNTNNTFSGKDILISSLPEFLSEDNINKNENKDKKDNNNKKEHKNKDQRINNLKYKSISNTEISDYVYNCLIPQNSINTVTDFSELFQKVNSGFSAIFIDTLDVAYALEAKGYEIRSVDKPSNEVVAQGSQEGFVENIRTNTSMLRRLVNNENLIIEKLSVGKVSKTNIALCYMNNITNNDLVDEVRFRINNVDIDSLLSSNTLASLIQDDTSSMFPELISTERPDKASSSLFGGRVVILVNGTPYALIAPAIFIDFLSSPEDQNQKHQYANLVKFIRCLAFAIALFLPGLYVAIINFHQELIPTDLTFAIAAGRKAIPFPVIVEILIMEISFELIREASLRIPSPMGSTIGIIGGLILGEAAVSANIVSPILIIIVALTGICSFAIPDYSLGFCLRIFRFMYIVLGYIAGFLGFAFGIFIGLVYLCSLKSFGVSYFSPYVPSGNKNTTNTLFSLPIWKAEKRSNFLNTKRPDSENHISIKWKKS